MSEPYLAIKAVMMPRDTNPHGTIFGGVILSNIDMAGAIGARHAALAAGADPAIDFVTVAINRVEFKKPVLVGDEVSFLTRHTRIGRTSITIRVEVQATRHGEAIDVTEAELVYVGVRVIDGDRKPVPLVGG